MSSLSISPQNVGTTTLTQLVDTLGQTNTKHDSKSIRLHEKPFGDTTVKVHTSWSRPGHGTERQEKRQDALNLVKRAMINEYNIDENSANKILGEVCTKPGRISLGDLKTLDKVMNLKKVRDPQMEKVERFNKLTLNELAELKGKWTPAPQGATGGMIVKDPLLPNGGVIVKCEPLETAKASSGTSKYISDVSTKLADKGIVLPIDAMIIGTLDNDNGSIGKIKDEIKSKETQQNKNSVSNSVERLEYVQTKEMVPMKGMFLEAVQDICDLPVTKRIELFKGGDFPQSLGGVMVLSKLFALGDHAGFGLTLNDVRNGQDGYTNVSNFMINPETNRLALIDYALVDGGRGKDDDGHKISGYSTSHITTAFSLMKKVAEQLAGDPSKTLELLQKRNDINIGQVFEQMEMAFPQGTFFIKDSEKNIDETHHLQSLSSTDKNKFMANLFIGALDALQLIADNTEAFSTGTPMFDNPSEVMQHVSTLAKGLDKIKASLQNYVDSH